MAAVQIQADDPEMAEKLVATLLMLPPDETARALQRLCDHFGGMSLDDDSRPLLPALDHLAVFIKKHQELYDALCAQAAKVNVVVAYQGHANKKTAFDLEAALREGVELKKRLACAKDDVRKLNEALRKAKSTSAQRQRDVHRAAQKAEDSRRDASQAIAEADVLRADAEACRRALESARLVSDDMKAKVAAAKEEALELTSHADDLNAQVANAVNLVQKRRDRLEYLNHELSLIDSDVRLFEGKVATNARRAASLAMDTWVH
jgi:chromosome segregation ATPase